MPRQDLAVSWKMRTLQSPRNKTPIKEKKHCLPASAQLRGTCVCVSICVCTCVVLYVGYISQCMMHVCQQGSKAPVKSKNAQSASQLPLGENQICHKLAWTKTRAAPDSDFLSQIGFGASIRIFDYLFLFLWKNQLAWVLVMIWTTLTYSNAAVIGTYFWAFNQYINEI